MIQCLNHNQSVTDMAVVITQVFPDEFHLNTLDQLLPAITRLNPHVNIKAIVIGLMNRLSSYAQAESSAESQEDREKSEEEAVSAFLEKIRISKERDEAANTQQKKAAAASEEANGDHAEGQEAEGSRPGR